MKISELLRTLADMMDSDASQENVAAPVNTTPVEQEPVTPCNVDNTESPVMVPPIQQELELLKKATGVKSFYTADDLGIEEQVDNPEADLAGLRRNAGIGCSN